MRWMWTLGTISVLMVLMVGCGERQQAAPPAAPAKPGEVKAPAPAPTPAGTKVWKIAVIPKGTTHVFWKSIHAGAQKAGQELGAEIIWQGPAREDDRKMQIEVVQNFISRKVDAIVLAPLDEVALVEPVAEAAKAGIKVIVIDSDLKSEAYTSFVATDNFQGGKLAAKRMAELLPEGKGKVMMLRYAVGSASTENRERGFLEGMKESAPNAELVSTDQYGGVTGSEAQKVGANLLNKFADLNGIFCPNESTTYGMLRALQQDGRAGKVFFVGFDSSDALLGALKNKEIHGLTLQNPFKMGYLGVATAIQALKGEQVEKRVDTGVAMVTVEKLEEPATKELVAPDLKKWLGEE